MARMNGTGPENKGSKTGRGLGLCQEVSEQEAGEKLGKGMGLRRNTCGGKGKGKRLRSGDK
jgi:hypothetical protein